MDTTHGDDARPDLYTGGPMTAEQQQEALTILQDVAKDPDVSGLDPWTVAAVAELLRKFTPHTVWTERA